MASGQGNEAWHFCIRAEGEMVRSQSAMSEWTPPLGLPLQLFTAKNSRKLSSDIGMPNDPASRPVRPDTVLLLTAVTTKSRTSRNTQPRLAYTYSLYPWTSSTTSIEYFLGLKSLLAHTVDLCPPAASSQWPASHRPRSTRLTGPTWASRSARVRLLVFPSPSIQGPSQTALMTIPRSQWPH